MPSHPDPDAPKEEPVEEEQPKVEETEQEDQEEQKPEEEAPAEEKVVEHEGSAKPKGKLKRLLAGYWRKKKLTLPLTLLVLVGVLLAVPFTRYKALGLVLKQTVDVSIKDATTSNPVTEASVTIAGKTAKTDKKGVAHLTAVPVGSRTMSVTKKYYTTTSSTVLVPILKQKSSFNVQMTATGRQVPLMVQDKITGKMLENVLVKSDDAEARSDKDGNVNLVLPAGKATVDVTLSADGFNDLKTAVKVTETVDKANTFELVPSGKLYFLSKKSGKIDVVKTNLDGSSRETVLAGTGKEEDQDTALLASRDWKYLALKSKRDSNLAKIYLIETDTDKLTTIDEGNATFSLTGWSEHRFVYTVNRNGVESWQSKQAALKSYNAESKQITTLDENSAEGTSNNDYATQSLSSVYIIDKVLVYNKRWFGSYNYAGLANKQMSVLAVQADGSNKHTLKDFQAGSNNFMEESLYKPNELYLQVHIDNQAAQFFETDGLTIKTAPSNITQDSFSKTYATYLLSPSGKSTFWADARDGKHTLFTGSPTGDDSKEIATLSEYSSYGWYSDNYLLVSKSGSELYIMPVAGTKDGGQVLKITDYHKPAFDYNGYGGGYGGL